MNNSWQTRKLKEVCTKITDGSHNPPKGIEESPYFMLSSKNIFDDKILLNNPRYLSQEDFLSEDKRTDIQPDDVLMTIVGTIGRVAIVPSNLNKFTLQRSVAVFKCKKDLINPRFLMYFLQSISNSIVREGKGVAQKGIYLKTLGEINVTFPSSLEEQVRIVKRLDQLTKLKQKRKQSIELLESYLKSVFIDLFGDPSTNPKSWKKVMIADLVSEVKYGTSAKAGEQGKFPYLRMNNITYSGDLNLDALKYIDLKPNEEDKYLAKKGDLLFNRTNSKELVGKTTVFNLDQPMAIAGYLIRVRTNEHALPEYISGYLNSDHGKKTLMHMCKSIIGMANINAQELQKIEILHPSVKLQMKYKENLIQTNKIKNKMITQAKEFDTQFQSLMQKSFSIN